MSNVPPLSPQLQVAEHTGSVHRFLHRWLQRLAYVCDVGVVPRKGIVEAYLSGDDVADWFDTTGLGDQGGPYDGWAICNGNNDTPALVDVSSLSGAEEDRVPLMRVWE